jgi:hypothetical protein
VKRWHRILVQVLVVAQLLSAAPFASALSAPSHGDAVPCADTHDCPCCPDGTGSVAACLSACVAAVGITPSFSLSLARAETPRATLPVVVALTRLSDPPTKPPPIA